jgi:hypothetical protein
MNCGEIQPGPPSSAGAPTALATQATAAAALAMYRHHASLTGGRHMRRHPLHLCAWPVLLGAALAIAACSSSTDIGGYTVTYRVGIDSNTVATIDSVKYDNGAGTLLKVASPAVTKTAPWVVTLTVSPGATIEGHAWLSGVVATHTASFVVVWMTATGALAGDSTSAPTAAATKFTMNLVKRTL